jgi:hypothetical protein
MQPQTLARGVRSPAGPRAARGCVNSPRAHHACVRSHSNTLVSRTQNPETYGATVAVTEHRETLDGASKRPFHRDYRTALVIAIVVGIMFALIIISSEQYGGNTGLRVASAIAAFILFGGFALLVALLVTVLSRRYATREKRATPPVSEGSTPPTRTNSDHGNGASGDPPSETGTRSESRNLDLLRLDQLDRRVREAAGAHWPYGNYVAAVESAARATNGHLKSRLSPAANLTEVNLVQSAFSLNDPVGGAVRLRFPGDRQSPSWKSRMNGAQNLGAACFSGIRNLAAHEYKLDWSREDCFEYLVLFSVFMRWVNECEVERSTDAT